MAAGEQAAPLIVRDQLHLVQTLLQGIALLGDDANRWVVIDRFAQMSYVSTSGKTAFPGFFCSCGGKKIKSGKQKI